MRIACGIDLVEDTRFEVLKSDSAFLSKCLQPSERELLDKLPSIFALKEAVVKALLLPADSWLEIEVSYQESGKTAVSLSDAVRPDGLVSLDCSVSHENGYTVAQVIMLFT